MGSAISKREKLCFGLLNLGNIPVITVVSSFLLIFYTNVVGLDPGTCATLFLVARVLDAVNDPFIGFFLDRMPHTRMGRFRVSLLVGAILCGLNYLLLWFGPLWAPSHKLVIAYISYILLGFLFPVMDISLNSLLPVMTDDMKERNSLSTIKGAVYMVGAVVVNMIAPIMIGDNTRPDGYVRFIILIVTIVIGCSAIGVFGVKERLQAQDEQKYSVKDLFRILTLRPVLTIFGSTFLTMIGTYIMNTVNIYYFIYVMNNQMLYSVTAAVVMLAMFVGIFLSQILSAKLGKKNVLLLGTILYGVFPLVRILNVTSVPLLMFGSVLGGLGNGLISPQTYSIQADNTDYVEYKTGQRAEAAIASLSSLTTKLGMGIGGAIPGYLLAFAKYDSTLAVQPAAVNRVLVFCVLVAPTILNIFSALLIKFGYNLDKDKLAAMFEELKKRREERA